jgi:deoxycytidylate deaminase
MPRRQGWVQIRADEYERLRADLEEAHALLRGSRRGHLKDCMLKNADKYKHTVPCCTCGADIWNAEVDAALKSNPSTLF